MGGLSGLSGLRGLSGLTAKPIAASAFDSDAQAFFTAANITDVTQQNAVNALVIGLKANSTWSKYQALYPFVGGSASQHSFNLKNSSQFQITWSGTVTHNANGITGNGTTGFGDTGYNPDVSGTVGNSSFGFYSRTNSTAFMIEMGARNNTPDNRVWLLGLWGSEIRTNMNNATDLAATANSQGYFLTSRTDINNIRSHRNGTTLINVSQSALNQPNRNILIGAFNENGLIQYHSTKNIAFAEIGLGLTSAEATSDYTTIQAFQTALGRQV